MTARSNLSVLAEMLTYARPAGSVTEAAFCEKYIATLPNADRDIFGNWHIIVGESPILWSCHTDTVHRAEGRQTVSLNPRTGVIRLSRRAKRHGFSCLGADDTAGVYLCHQMVLAGVPGHYVFHYGEEIGGVGSSDLAQHAPELIADSLFAIALDRAGTSDIISHQYGGRCCSDAFVDSLSDQLAVSGLTYRANHGTFTDTANYVDTIGECTNLSVGYGDAHSPREWLDTGHVDRLFAALCALDQSALVQSRRPGDADPERWQMALTLTRIPYDYRDAVCEYCFADYDCSKSDAEDYETYCSEVCETSNAPFTDLKHSDSIYLDPVYDDLARQLKRNGGK